MLTHQGHPGYDDDTGVNVSSSKENIHADALLHQDLQEPAPRSASTPEQVEFHNLASPATKALTVVIPCFNEKNTLCTVVDAVRAQFSDGSVEIVVVDDCSVDGTRELLQEKSLSRKLDQVIFHPNNMGKGAALRSGFEVARGEIIVVQDADLEYDPAELKKLLVPIQSGEADVVYGSRFAEEGRRERGYSLSFLANKVLTSLSNYCSGTHITDMETCYKMFRREVLDQISIEENRFGFEPEITAKVSRSGFKIHEVPISYHPRTFTEGKKIGWRDAVRAIVCILKYNFERRAEPTLTAQEYSQ